jgi:perosamine synthetase
MNRRESLQTIARPFLEKTLSVSAADLDESDLNAVLEVLRSGRLASGPKCEEFERMIADYVGVKHAVAVNSGTSALHLIVKALEIGPGDEVIVPSFTFAASVNVILYERATPVFVDIDPATYTLDPQDLERKIGPRTKAIMAVDVFGHPAEWDDVLRIAHRSRLRVIDDSCEALGAEFRGSKLGQFGDAAAFAFYPNKQMTTGEGGALVTNNGEIANLARSLRNHGRDEGDGWLEHRRLGYNYRMDEMSAALGISQLKRMKQFLFNREQVAALYNRYLHHDDRIQLPSTKPYVRKSWFVYVVLLADGLNREAIARAMQSQGISVRCYFSPMHLQPYIRNGLGTAPGTLPTTESVGLRTLALPFHNNLQEAEVHRVVDALDYALSGAE